ncbi:MAG: hypothetical protein JWQ17_2290 [Tardiphaga sp.]|nr:hypothetical protein [Tardiphaga sp.]
MKGWGVVQQAADLEYARMKAFLAFYTDRYLLNLATLPPEKWPIACLEVLEKKGMKTALNGLRQAINDCVEASFHFDHVEVEKLDSELRTRGIITLSELRRRYSKGYARIKKRSKIKNETEYYLIRNVLEDPTEKTHEERELLEKMISDYEGA